MRSKKPIVHDLSQLELPDVQSHAPRSEFKLKSIAFAVVLSLIIHSILVLTSVLFEPKIEPGKTAQKKQMRAQLVPQKPPKKDRQDLKQVVSIAKPQEQKRPKEAKLAAEYDSSVSEETRSRQTSLTPERLSEKPQKALSANQIPQPGQNENPNQVPSVKPAQDVANSKTGLIPKKEVAQSALRSKLIPTWKDQGMESSMPFSDHLKNIEEDAATRLNTWQWVHASFFVRIKEAVARRWDPNRAIKRNDPAGKIVGKNDRVTQVLAKINKEGQLLSIQVIRESGVYFLDDEALNAFKGAAPFSNPPKELFASNDTFEFPFGFMLTYNKGFKFDMDWKPY